MTTVEKFTFRFRLEKEMGLACGKGGKISWFPICKFTIHAFILYPLTCFSLCSIIISHIFSLEAFQLCNKNDIMTCCTRFDLSFAIFCSKHLFPLSFERECRDGILPKAHFTQNTSTDRWNFHSTRFLRSINFAFLQICQLRGMFYTIVPSIPRCLCYILHRFALCKKVSMAAIL